MSEHAALCDGISPHWFLLASMSLHIIRTGHNETSESLLPSTGEKTLPMMNLNATQPVLVFHLIKTSKFVHFLKLVVYSR